jgi:ABC-2 type transport system permease protein
MFVIGMPTFIYLINAGTHNGGFHEDGLDLNAYFLGSMLTYAAMGGAMATSGAQLALDRADGWLRQLRTTPLTDRSWLAAKLAQSAVLVIPSKVVVPPLRWVDVLVTLVIGSLPFGLIGQAIGQGLDSESAQPASVGVLIGFAFLGGLFIPGGVLPTAIRLVGQGTPTYALASVSRAALAGRAPKLGYVASLLAWTVLAGGAAVALRDRAVRRPAMA